jgi:long-subunit fatty acid transport protein
LNYYFIKGGSDWKGQSADFNNGWELGLAATYKVKPELKLGCGFLNTKSGASDKSPYLNENPALDSRTLGLGAVYSVNNNIDVTLTGSRTQYLSESNEPKTPYEVEFKKVVNNIAIGGQYRFDM